MGNDAGRYAVEVPSGGTWVLDISPTWGKVKQFRNLSEDADYSEMLVPFIVEWDRDEEVSAEALDNAPALDVVTVFQAFNEQVLPLFDRLTKGVSAT